MVCNGLIFGSDLTVVNAARVSFGKRKTELNEQDKKLINYLVTHKHNSPFYHIQIEGCFNEGISKIISLNNLQGFVCKPGKQGRVYIRGSVLSWAALQGLVTTLSPRFFGFCEGHPLETTLKALNAPEHPEANLVKTGRKTDAVISFEDNLGSVTLQEHAQFYTGTVYRFHVKAPLFVVQQMLRHRVGVQVNQISHRYVELTEPEFYNPSELRLQSKNNRQASINETVDYHIDVSSAVVTYKELLEKGVAREQARMVLPSSLLTELIMTIDETALDHFIKLRSHPGAQYEIQQFAEAMDTLRKGRYAS